MPITLIGTRQNALDLNVTVPEDGDTSQGMRLQDIVQALLDNDATLENAIARGTTVTPTIGTVPLQVIT